VSRVKANNLFVPFLADIALSGVRPVISLFNIIMPQNPRVNNIVHVASHRIFNQKVESDLIDTHKEEGHLSGRAILL
jgi:hypothetical protein